MNDTKPFERPLMQIPVSHSSSVACAECCGYCKCLVERIRLHAQFAYIRQVQRAVGSKSLTNVRAAMDAAEHTR